DRSGKSVVSDGPCRCQRSGREIGSCHCVSDCIRGAGGIVLICSKNCLVAMVANGSAAEFYRGSCSREGQLCDTQCGVVFAICCRRFTKENDSCRDWRAAGGYSCRQDDWRVIRDGGGRYRQCHLGRCRCGQG